MLYSRPSVDAATALDMARTVLAGANRASLAVAVAVVDAPGHVLALVRMDGVAAPIAEFARENAYTAATMGKPTAAFGDRMDSSPTLRLGLANRPRLLTWGGGLPLVADGRIVGAIGVSGARDDEDIALATEAAAHAGMAVTPRPVA